MEFINNKETKKIRVDEESGYGWRTVRHGEIVDLPEKVGLFHGFTEYVEEVIKPLKKTKVVKPTKTKKRNKK